MSLLKRGLCASIPLLLIAPGLFYAYRLFRSDLLLSGTPTIESLSQALRFNPRNGELFWFRGRFRHYSLDRQDLPSAVADYERALELNPRLGQAWADLADAVSRTGDTARAEACLDQARRVWTFSPSIHWQAGNWYLLQGNLSKMYELLGKAVSYDVNRIEIALETAWKVDPARSEILSKLVPDTPEANLRCLNFVLAHNDLELAREVWTRCLRNPPARADAFYPLVFRYIDSLIAAHKLGDATTVWRDALDKTEMAAPATADAAANLIWNGSFELAPLGGGFDWRRFPSEDFDIDFAARTDSSGGTSLRVTFHGTNPEFLHVYQLVHLPRAGNYTLEYSLSTEGLTSDQKPYLTVEEFPGLEPTLFQTDGFPASSPWRKYAVRFHVDKGGGLVRLALRRTMSGKFDNRIQGSVWLDDVSIRPDQPAAARSTP